MLLRRQASRTGRGSVNAIRVIQADIERAERRLLAERRASVERSLSAGQSGIW